MLTIAGAHSRQKQNQLLRRYRQGELRRLRKGIYVPAEYEELKLWERFDLQCLAAAVSRPKNFLMGKAAASVLDIPYGQVPRHVDMGGPGGSAGVKQAMLQFHRPVDYPAHPILQLPPPFAPGQVTSPAQTVLDVARWHELGEAVQAIDHCLHHRIVKKPQLALLLAEMKGRHGVRQAGRALQLSHPAAESPRESALRIKMWEAGFPPPHVQATLLDQQGLLLGRPDFFYPGHSVGVEYDGEGKHRGRYGVDPGTAAVAEMQRTRQFANAGVWLIRVTARTFHDGSWRQDLTRALQQSRGKVFPGEQWSSAGLAWTPGKLRRTGGKRT